MERLRRASWIAVGAKLASLAVGGFLLAVALPHAGGATGIFTTTGSTATDTTGTSSTTTGTSTTTTSTSTGPTTTGTTTTTETPALPLAGRAFDDLDEDSGQDEGEPGLPGVTIFLDRDADGTLDSVEPSIASDASGNYSFLVAPGTHLVRQVVPSGRRATTPNPRTVIVGEALVPPVDFGSATAVDLRVTKTGPSTDVTGRPVAYTIVVTNAGARAATAITLREIVPPNAVLLSVTDGGEALSCPVVADAPTCSLGGLEPAASRTFVARIQRSTAGAAVNAVEVASAQIDANSSDNSATASTTFSLAADASIAGTVYADTNRDGVRGAAEPGLGGVRIFLDADADSIHDSGEASVLTSSSNGAYELSSLVPGTHLVRQVVPAGWLQTTPAPAAITLTPAAEVEGVDFGDARTSGGSSTPPGWESSLGSMYADTLSRCDDCTSFERGVGVSFANLGGFTFPFNAQTYGGTDVLDVSTNGFVSLLKNVDGTVRQGEVEDGCCRGNAADLARNRAPIIAPFWTDLDAGDANRTQNPEVGIYQATFDDNGNGVTDRVVITWDTQFFDCGDDDTVETCRAILQLQLRSNGAIVFGYSRIDPGPPNDRARDDVLVGASPGNGATAPGRVLLTDVPFDTGASSTFFQEFDLDGSSNAFSALSALTSVGSPTSIESLVGRNFVLTPNAAGGYSVTGDAGSPPPPPTQPAPPPAPPTTTAIVTTTAPEVTTTAELPPPPPPEEPGTFNAQPTEGTVLLNGQVIDGVVEIDSGDVVDARNGTIEIASDTGSAEFSEGAFKITQADRENAVTRLELVGGDFSICTAPAPARRSGENKPVRRLWGKGTGKFETKARYSSATVRGTLWLTEDQCEGSLTLSAEGSVVVFDFSLRRTFTVDAGEQYLAEEPPPPAPGRFVGDPEGQVVVNGRPVDQDTQIRSGDTVDVRSGSIELTTTSGAASFYSGVFTVTQTGGANAFTVLTLAGGNFATCGKRKLAAKNPPKSKAQNPPKTNVRSLWGKGKGKFRTKSRFSSATVRGTTWLTIDRCDGSLTVVRDGIVEVFDLTLRRTVEVGAGEQYLAPASK